MYVCMGICNVSVSEDASMQERLETEDSVYVCLYVCMYVWVYVMFRCPKMQACRRGLRQTILFMYVCMCMCTLQYYVCVYMYMYMKVMCVYAHEIMALPSLSTGMLPRVSDPHKQTHLDTHVTAI